jgi:hypothetical protein
MSKLIPWPVPVSREPRRWWLFWFPLDDGSDRASSVLSLYNRRERSSECFGGDHHLVNVTALRALKGAEVVPNSCGHNASEHHAGMALWAGGTLDSSIDMVRQKIGFLHDASLEQAGARHSLSPVMRLREGDR